MCWVLVVDTTRCVVLEYLVQLAGTVKLCCDTAGCRCYSDLPVTIRTAWSDTSHVTRRLRGSFLTKYGQSGTGRAAFHGPHKIAGRLPPPNPQRSGLEPVGFDMALLYSALPAGELCCTLRYRDGVMGWSHSTTE